MAEARFPVHVERYELNADVDAGAGRRRGGLGVVREYRLLDVERASGYGSLGGWHRRPWSLAGGKEGSNNYLEYEKLDGTLVRRGRIAHIELEPGDRVRVVTGTGGGHGDPLEREPALVLADVLDGYVSAAQARSVYGVAIDEASGRVDEDETAALRARPGEPADEPHRSDGHRRHVHRPRLLRHRDARRSASPRRRRRPARLAEGVLDQPADGEVRPWSAWGTSSTARRSSSTR